MVTAAARDPGDLRWETRLLVVVTAVLTAFGIASLYAAATLEKGAFGFTDVASAIADFAGLNQRSPLYAAIMALCLFSLAGIPPMVGFYAKLSVLQALIASGQAFHIGLAVFAVIMSLIGAFYYLRVIKVMYFDEPITASSVVAPMDVRVVLCINGALVLGLRPPLGHDPDLRAGRRERAGARTIRR